jgi:hypothetical protein
MLHSEFTNSASYSVNQLTALGHASLPFGFWRGTLSFRFEVVASGFHRGKLMFIYEPNAYGLTLIESNVSNLNQQYIYYLDIEEDRDVTIDCGFVFDKLFANITPVDANDFASIFRKHHYSVSDISVIEEYANKGQSIGALYVRPFTKLTSVSTTVATSIKVNCYVYSDDMEFAVPEDIAEFDATREILSESQPIKSRLDATTGARQVNVGSNTRTSETRILINKTQPSCSNMYLYHFGEKIESFRALLKRDMGVAKVTASANTDGYAVYNIPLYPCSERFGVPFYGTALSNSATTFTNNAIFNLFNHLRYGYLFCKGGYRYKLIETNPLQYRGWVCVDRAYLEGNDIFRYDTGFDPNFSPKLSGSVLFELNTNAGVEVEIPYYSDNLFEMSCLPYEETTDTRGGLFNTYLNGAMINIEHSKSSHGYTAYIAGHAAEDFTFFRFQGGCFYTV